MAFVKLESKGYKDNAPLFLQYVGSCNNLLLYFYFLVNYLNYGVFNSYAPMYDSSSSNLSKEDSDLLLATYGDEAGVQYAKR